MERVDEFGLWVSDNEGETWVLTERTDDNGRWITNDNGISWALVEPSEAFLQRRADAEATQPPYPPLDPTGALATLLVVVGTLDLGDAANAIHEEPAHLEHEALAWGL